MTKTIESFWKRWLDAVLQPEIDRRVALRVRAVEDAADRLASAGWLNHRDTYPRDRREYDRQQVLAGALEAWRVNPLARRIVELTSQYVVGGGLSIECDHSYTHQFLQEWWHHRLNRMPIRVFEWCEELSRSGEIFVLISTDASGMSYVRAVPAAQVEAIETAENDVEQELYVVEKPAGAELSNGMRWRVYDEKDDRRLEDGRFETTVLHYAVNRPVGAAHGESDLAPLLRWLARYAAWLEDRARLNRFRNTFLFWVKARFTSSDDRLRRQAELSANPPNPGSILVTDENETWTVISPNLASFEAAEDGLALKKMISAGSGIPLHFIAEPESATRTTAESAGGPTFRHYQQRQLYFLWMIGDIARVVIRRRKMCDRAIDRTAEVKIHGSDISARDNASLATAAATIVAAFLRLRQAGLIDDAELLRLAYRFAGEVVDVEDMLRRGKSAPKLDLPEDLYPFPQKIKVDPISGEPRGIDR